LPNTTTAVPVTPNRLLSFYRAMLGRERRLCQSMSSVCPSVTFRYRDHVGWNTSKIISRLLT